MNIRTLLLATLVGATSGASLLRGRSLQEVTPRPDLLDDELGDGPSGPAEPESSDPNNSIGLGDAGGPDNEDPLAAGYTPPPRDDSVIPDQPYADGEDPAANDGSATGRAPPEGVTPPVYVPPGAEGDDDAPHDDGEVEPDDAPDENGPADALADDNIMGDTGPEDGSVPPTPPANFDPNDPDAPIGSGDGGNVFMTPPPRPINDTPPIGPDLGGPQNVFVPDTEENLDDGNGDGEDTGPGSFQPADGNSGPGDVNQDEAQAPEPVAAR